MTNYRLTYTMVATINIERQEEYAFQATSEKEARKKANAHLKRMEGTDGRKFVIEGVVGLNAEYEDVEIEDVYPDYLTDEDEGDEIDFEEED